MDSDKCETHGCSNPRDKKNRRRVCLTCRSKTWRKNNPLLATYNSLKHKAKQRDIPFSLTIGEWKRFCDDTGYLELRGKGKNDMTVDRKVADPFLGYTYGNIQILSHSDNDKKGQVEKRQRKGWANVKVAKQPNDPF